MMEGLHHHGCWKVVGPEHLFQVFQFLLLLAFVANSVCPVFQALDHSGQDPRMVVRVKVYTSVSVGFLPV